MSETVNISQRTATNIERTLNRVLIRLKHDRLDETIQKKMLLSFLDVDIKRLRNMVYDRTIPATAYITTVNINRKDFK